MLPCCDTLFHDVLPRVPLAKGDATLIFGHELSPFPSFSCGRLFTQSCEWFATRKVKSFKIRQIQFTHREGLLFTPSLKGLVQDAFCEGSQNTATTTVRINTCKSIGRHIP